jgi:pilus assembly protein CpaB
MLLRIVLFAMMAVGLAGFGAVAWISTHPPGPAQAVAAPAPAEAKVKVLVAAHELRAGNLLKPEDINAGELLEAKLPPGAVADTPQNRMGFVGAMIRRSVQPGEPVLPQDILRPGDHGFLAAVLAPNMRAITIGVDIVSGSAGLIWPGDRVDLILTQSLDSPSLPSGRRLAAETVLSNIRVIAVDQHLVEGATPDSGEPKGARTVTLEVTNEQAERVSVAERLGHLSLAVRSADQSVGAEAMSARRPAREVTWAGDVSPALRLNNPDRRAPNTVRVFQGASEGKEFHF